MKVETQNINRQFLSLNFGDVMWKPPQQFVLQPVQKPLMARCINLPSPPLPKGDFAPFQEMYLTSGIISCWNAARCDSRCGINGLLGFSHYYPINYKYPHFLFQHSLVCWLLFLILVWIDRVKIREIILRNNLNFNDRRHRQQEICADRLVLNLLLFLLLPCYS